MGGSNRSGSPTILGNLLGNAEGPRTSGTLHSLLHKGPSPPIFSQRAPSPDYFSQLQPPAGKCFLKKSFAFFCLFVKDFNTVGDYSKVTFPQLFIGFAVGPRSMMPEEFADIHRSISPGTALHQQVRSI